VSRYSRVVSEQVRTLQVEDRTTAAVAVAAGGVLALVLGLILGSRVLRVLGLAAALTGGGLYARRRLAERGAKIDAAESRMRSELDDLDPVARAQVLADLARSSI
jgi:hypothetical protein